MQNKPFARIANHTKLGPVLAMIGTNSDDEPVISFIVDSHPNDLSPTTVSLSFEDSVDLYEKLAEMSEDQILAMGEGIHNQAVSIGLPNLLVD